MKNDIERLYSIDKYLKGELSGPALDEFRNLLRMDSEFSHEVESHRAIVEGIKFARRQQLIAILNGESAPSKTLLQENKLAIELEKAPFEEIIKESHREIKFNPETNYNSWYFAAAAVLFAAFFLYALFGYYMPRQNMNFGNVDTLKSENLPTEDIERHIEKNKQNNFVENKNDSAITREEDKLLLTTTDSLEVKKDKKIGEKNYLVAAFETNLSTGTSNDKTNKVSFNDSINLPKTSNLRRINGINLKIEYWQSVVNFRGYKLSDNKLQLFDIKPEENVSLKYLDNNLYIKKSGMNYKLIPSGNFEQLQKVNNTEIINKLDSN